MKMPKVSLLAALAAGALLAFAPAVRAEDKPERPNRPERREGAPRGDMLKRMGEELNLTADQKTKLQEVFKAQQENRKELKDAAPEERRTAMKEAREKLNAKVKEILTAEQYAKWEKLRDERRPGGPGGPNAEGPKAKRPGQVRPQ